MSPTVSTLVALALALGDIRGEPIQLYELVYWDGFVSVSGDLVLSGEALAGFVSRLARAGTDKGHSWRAGRGERGSRPSEGQFDSLRSDINPRFVDLNTDLCVRVERRSGEAEQRAPPTRSASRCMR